MFNLQFSEALLLECFFAEWIISRGGEYSLDYSQRIARASFVERLKIVLA